MRKEDREILIRLDQKVDNLNVELLRVRDHVTNIYTTVSNDIRPEIASQHSAIAFLKWAVSGAFSGLVAIAAWLYSK